MQKVLLSSGGMDSWLLAHEPELAGAIHLFVDIGQKYTSKERTASADLAFELGATWERVQGPNLGQYEHSTGIIPFRNAQMLLLAGLYGEEIYFGVIADEINSDKSPEFVQAIQDTMNISHRAQYWTHGKNYKILTPFRQYTKSELVRRFLANGGSLDRLLTSVSCYDAGDQHCGRCPSCFKRWVALVNATNQDNWEQWGFVQHPYTWKSRGEWYTKMKDYSEERAGEIFGAFVTAGEMLTLKKK
jgi:7-cyano-7-deazaguanine synthase in queuosine biosynthesis